MIMMILRLLILLLAVAALAIILYPPLGRKPSKAPGFGASDHYQAGKFYYPLPTDMKMDVRTAMSLIRDLLLGGQQRRPARPIPVESLDVSSMIAPGAKQDAIVWLGHSASMLRIDGKTLLLDPMLGRAPSPFPWFGGGRYSEAPPILPDELPEIDAVIFSHDHYDHLDYGTIKALHRKVGRFFVPLGVGGHLVRWGVDPAKIEEFDWWVETEWQGLRLACAPARHFSGRSVHDRQSTLFCSWAILGEEKKVFFSGDSGYGPHFREIGERYGPFDLTLMECGQYDPRWGLLHMMPEETVQAHLDVQGQVMIPIHWGGFTLSLHSWTDPVERATEEGRRLGAIVATPRIGEVVPLDSAAWPSTPWWRSITR